MTKTIKTASVALNVRDFMKAWGGAQGEGRATAFRENPCEETMQALLDAAEKNLRKMMKGGKISTSKKSAKVKATKSTKTTKRAAASKEKAKANAAAIKKLTAKIVSLREKRAETDDKKRRAKLLEQIKEAKQTRADLRAA